jgi:hypothetical protein
MVHCRNTLDYGWAPAFNLLIFLVLILWSRSNSQFISFLPHSDLPRLGVLYDLRFFNRVER